MCECEITAIEKECSSAPPGVKTTWHHTCVDEVQAIGAATNHAVSTVTMRAAAAGPPAVTAGKFYKLAGAKDDFNDFKTTRDAQGNYVTTGTIFVSKQTAAKAKIFNSIGEENSILIVPDKAGNLRIVGDLEDPCTFRFDEVVKPRNGYQITYEWESGHSPWYFTGTIPV